MIANSEKRDMLMPSHWKEFDVFVMPLVQRALACICTLLYEIHSFAPHILGAFFDRRNEAKVEMFNARMEHLSNM